MLRSVTHLELARRGWAAIGDEALGHADALYDLARHLTRNDADAADLVQETYAHALRAADQFQPGTHLKAWLLRILRNAFLTTRRREGRAPPGGNVEAELARPDEEGDAWLRGDLELERMRHIVGAEIEAALAQLSEEARTVILLDLDGLTEAEMAHVIGCPPGTVKSRLSRARAALRERLAEYAR